MLFCLDTSTLSDIVVGDVKTVASLRKLRRASIVFVSVITRGELLHGIERLPEGQRRKSLHDRATRVLAKIPTQPVTPEMAELFARLKADAQNRGLALNDHDIWIAATAMHFKAVLVTRDRDFSRAKWCETADWAAIDDPA